MVPKAGLTTPAYDRSTVEPGIMHFGVGNFHRSHQAMYLERLLRRGLASEWGIIGVGFFPRDAKMGEVLRAQDFTYTLVELAGDDTKTAMRIRSIIDYLHAPSDPRAVLERLASPALRIVSLTITEGGYGPPEGTGESVAASSEASENPPTVFGTLAAGLKLRRDRGIPPFTVASCDNILGNGDVARHALVTFARSAYGHEFADWIDTAVAFPNSMVDRITPVTSDVERDLVRDVFGIDDAWPVVCEPFAQWVIEDDFPLGRPPWDEVGAQLVEDVSPYEQMKLRLLNGSHQAMAYTGLLRGHTYVHEAMADQVVVDIVERYMDEAAATLRLVEGIDVPAYREQLMERFGNPTMRDTLERLAADASDRVPTFLLPVAQERSIKGLASPAAAEVTAAWAARSWQAVRANKTLDDRQAGRVAAALADIATDSASFLKERDWFGGLAADEDFVAVFERAFAEYTANWGNA